jgi:hypothetical protein
MTIEGPNDNGFWAMRGDFNTMLQEVGSNHKHMPYDDYKAFRIRFSNTDKAMATVQATKIGGYGLVGNNCADHVWRVFAALGGELPWLQTHPAPNDWFMSLNGKPHALAGRHGTVDSTEDMEAFANSLEVLTLPQVTAQSASGKHLAEQMAVGSIATKEATGNGQPAEVQSDEAGTALDSAITAQGKQTLEGIIGPTQARYYRLMLTPEQEVAFTIYTSIIDDSSFANASFAVQDVEGGILGSTGISVESNGEDYTRTLYDFTAEDEGEHIFRIRNDESGNNAVSLKYKIKLK